jgi:hypothetical protein
MGFVTFESTGLRLFAQVWWNDGLDEAANAEKRATARLIDKM